MLRFTTCWLLFAVSVSSQETEPFRDPGPPQVAELTPMKAPEPSDFAERRFVAAPKTLAKDAVVEDWPAFLGPRRDGRSRETRLLTEWPEGGPALVWSMGRGQGYASPAVQGDRVVFPHRVGGDVFVDCLQAETGRRFWRFSYPTDYRGDYITDSGPRATPTIDGDSVYVHGVEGWLHCLELSTGRVLWKRDLATEFEVDIGFFGVVGSPLVVGDLLVINLGAKGGPSVAAFDKRTGRLVWGCGTKWGMSCASPVLANVHGRPRLLAIAGGKSRPPVGGLMVMDPATGALDFDFAFRSRTYESVVGATPVVAGSRAFLTASYNTGTAALELDDDGGFEVAWSVRRFGVEFATPLYVDGHLFAVAGASDRAGAVVCLDPKTGEELSRTDLTWEETVPYMGEQRKLPFSVGNGCLIWADGAFWCLGDNGHLLRLACGPKGARVLARASLFRANESWTPPVVSRGLLYVCQNKRERFGDEAPRLLCFDLRGE